MHRLDPVAETRGHAARRALLTLLAGALVAGVLGMHVLTGAAGPMASAGAMVEPGVDEAGRHVAGAMRHGVLGTAEALSGATGPVVEAAAGTPGHALMACAAEVGGVCLALLGGLALVLVLVRRREPPRALAGADPAVARTVSVLARRRPAACPDLHALSILRC